MRKNEKVAHLPWFGIGKLLPFLKPYRKLMFWMIFMGAFTGYIDTLYPLFNRYALDTFVAHQDLNNVWIFIGLYLVMLIVQSVANYYSMVWSGVIEMNVDRDLRNKAFNHLQTLSFSYFNQNNVGYIHARIMSDTGKIGELVAWRLMDMVWYGTYIVFVFVNMLLIQWKLALYVLLVIPFAVWMMRFFQKHLIVLNHKVRQINSRITGNFNEGITGVKSIKSLVIEDTILNDFKKDTLSMKHTSIRTQRFSAAFMALVTMMSSIILAIVLWQGGHITIEGIIQIGTLSIFMNYAVYLIEPIQMVINTIAALIGIQVNIERFSNFMETESMVVDSDEVIEKYGDMFHPKKENWEPLVGDVEFKDVSFQYPDGNELVLEHFNLKVKQGTHVAIVGETGAGKSTLVNLICRFYEPTEGQILIDGKDVKERSQLWLHRNIGYVLQTPHLFSGTVRENLKYGNPDASDEQILDAIHTVSADFVLEKLDKGLDSEIQEGGDSLSTGEKQLLSFARALLVDPKILVLDEATSSIDTLTEKAIQDAIETAIKGRTSFMIAHRLSTVVDADVILVVQDGKIVERGTHPELMRKKGYYYELYTRQFEQMATEMA
ncbi:MAG: ABC transporter ATP-binding protein [Faecalicoccus sp.]|nr:ABC transporter ATP-binding protein [Faecalicoccus sp.]